MSKIKNTLTLLAPERLKGKIDDSLVDLLRAWITELVRNHRSIWNAIEFGGASTNNWYVREATAADVAAGNAKAAGNLLVEHKTNGRKREFQA